MSCESASVYSKHSALLNGLANMQDSPYYTSAKETLRQAEQLIYRQEQEIKKLQEQLAAIPEDVAIMKVELDLYRHTVATDGKISSAALDVLAERRRQIAGENFDPAHDDTYDAGQLPLAAACYAITAGLEGESSRVYARYWPWPRAFWKPTTPRRNLVKAGALILADIERIDRAAAKEGVPS